MRDVKLHGMALLLGINLLTDRSIAQIANRYSVVIDEILADPSPTVALPNAEYIELKNVSEQGINLKQWKVTDGSSVATITLDYILQPDSFVVITSISGATSLATFGAVIGVTNFPSLNNESDVISLYAADGRLIHAVAYQSTWFNNALKMQGGWALEMIDTRSPCAGEKNWSASIDEKGGTPCKKNSVDAANPDKQPPLLSRAYSMDSITAVLVFNESLDSNEAANPNHYSFDELSNSTLHAVVIPPLYNEVKLTLARALQRRKFYELTVTGVKDCSGNLLGTMNKTRVGLAEATDSLDVVINEILFNPLSDGVDYVELLNINNKILDVSNLYVSNRNAMGNINTPTRISELPYLLFPGDFLVISESKINTQRHFIGSIVNAMLDVPSFPSFPDDHGTVVILNAQGRIVDELSYDEDWHFALVRNKEGISLERIDPLAKTQWRDNWTSAASIVGYGTPGYQNSQFKTSSSQQGSITIDPPLFSPDHDGIDDICFINYQLSEPNNVANVWVFDAQGREVRKLYSNTTLAQKGFLKWDGLAENFKLLPVGIYVLYIEIFNQKGTRQKFKKAVVLARKF